MSHHGSEDPAKRAQREATMREMLNTASFRGATGQFPQGRLNAADEGQLQMGIGGKDGKVFIEFGKSVKWVAMSPQEAADMASILIKQARALGTIDVKL